MRRLILIFLCLALCFSSCRYRKIPTEGLVEAKIIEYHVEYLDTKAGSVPTSILPSKMNLIFAEHFALNRIDGFLGQFSLSYIANLKTESVTTLLKFFDKKYYYPGKPGELPCGINEMKNLTISRTGNSKDIYGYNARELHAKISDNEHFYIYVTDIDNIKNPNITTPYRNVEGVLLEFYTSLSIMQMKLSASRLYKKEINWSLFNVPDDYEKISRDEMEKVINELFR